MLQLGIETVSYLLLQLMARMDNGLKLEYAGPTFSSSNAMPGKITKKILAWLVLPVEICLISSSNSSGAFCAWLKAVSEYLLSTVQYSTVQCVST